MERKPNLLLVDGMALLFRSFFATAVTGQFMKNSKGIPTNAIQGFMRHLFYSLENIDPSHLAICWDMGSKTFRNDMFAGYKANRSAPPEELIPQFDLVKEVVEAFSLTNHGLVGYEADDCIGTIAKKMKEDTKVTVLTGDRDLLQLLDDNIEVRILQKGFGNYKTYTEALFVEELGITPKQFIDVKALMGDTSDGYPGVRGIGEKTAIKLMKEYGTIEELLLNMEKLTPGQRKKIEEDLDMLHLSRKLAEINCEVPISFNLESTIRMQIPRTFLEIIEELELKTIRRHLLQTNWIEQMELA
ncbi:5'-3' exonuclease [Heyndrickxia sporothermodurans]|nr:5'-3' exonuclease [Heyndrickxia sporothermodurans]